MVIDNSFRRLLRELGFSLGELLPPEPHGVAPFQPGLAQFIPLEDERCQDARHFVYGDTVFNVAVGYGDDRGQKLLPAEGTIFSAFCYPP
jgi:hypothetical protein